MIKVYQTKFDNKTGNCLAAVWASLLHLDLKDVPNFVEFDDYYEQACSFIENFGYKYLSYVINEKRKDLDPAIKSQYRTFNSALPDFGHINGVYEATVLSPKFFQPEEFQKNPGYKPIAHAVIVDKNLNIIHDPNPNYRHIKQYPLADMLGCNGVLGVSLFIKK